MIQLFLRGVPFHQPGVILDLSLPGWVSGNICLILNARLFLHSNAVALNGSLHL